MKKALCFASVFLLLAAAGYSQKFSLRFGAGIGTVSGGDIAEGIRGLTNFLKDEYHTAYSLLAPGIGPDFSAELVLHFNPSIGIGLGLGYLSAGRESSVDYTTSTGTAVTQAIHPRFGAIPVTATFHYYPSAPASKVRLDCSAGFGVYVAHYNHDETFGLSIPGGTGAIEYTYASGSKIGLGGHLGVGAAYSLSGKVALVAGVSYRLVSFKPAAGTWTETGSGIAGSYRIEGGRLQPWYIETTSKGLTYPQVVFDTDVPAGGDVANARQARVGLSGVLFSVGIRIDL